MSISYRQVEFKRVFTNNTINISVNPLWSVRQFIETIAPELAIQFSIDENDIEIVESGKYKNGCKPEGATSLVPSSIRLCDNWDKELRNLAFYVRRKNHIYPQLENISFNGDCPICLDTSILHRRYQCSHGLCSQCYTRCQTVSINRCSLCISV